MSEDEIRELAQASMKNAILLSERIGRLSEQYSGEVVEEIMIDVVKQMLKNCDDRVRYLRIASTTIALGQRLGSEKLQAYGAHHKEAWEEQFDGSG